MGVIQVDARIFYYSSYSGCHTCHSYERMIFGGRGHLSTGSKE